MNKLTLRNGITAHCIVKNEENWVWYAINSIINYVDEIFVYDTGSQDKTIKIIQSIKNSKLKFKTFKNINGVKMTEFYQKMIDETKTTWIMVVDGDEIWYEDSIKEVLGVIKNGDNKQFGIITPFYSLVGDIFHYQREDSGKYQIGPHKGHVTIRAMNMAAIKGFKAGGLNRSLGYFSKFDMPVQELDFRKYYVMSRKFFHTTHLQRSSKDEVILYPEKRKKKLETGIAFPHDFYYPEVFFIPRPSFVPSPWRRMNTSFVFMAYPLNILRIAKRKFDYRRTSDV